ncbi:MAG: hypothetical protein H7338_25085 [Candidatus Sericytochromatia bacterium]|nr:hypothetical protein [Candidatus Sericytochromatia bacterium]
MSRSDPAGREINPQGKPLRVFLGLTETAGTYHGLRQGFEAMGHSCLFADLSRNPFRYGGSSQTWQVRLARWGYQRYLDALSASMPRKLGWFVIDQIARLPLFLHALLHYDLFIFGFNATFYRQRDLPLLRWLGKTVICQYHGSDTRPPYLDGAYLSTPGMTLATCVGHTRRLHDVITWVDRYATAVIDTPAQGHFRKVPFVNWLKIGVPVKPARVPTPDELESAYARMLTGGPVRILHSPSFPEAKGTPLIRALIERLRSRGHAIDFIEIKGMPNEVVLAELARCDFVIDQAYADTPMAGFAAEAAWFGKVSVVGGYQRALWRSLLTDEELPPSLYVHPDDMEAAVERLILDPAARVSGGRRVRQFIETRWSPHVAARNYLAIAEGTSDKSWWVTPESLIDFHGCCLAESRLRDGLRTYVGTYGAGALCLDDKPVLRDSIVAFAAEGDSVVVT